jgi:tetratricopeptide (TPR) repeat protein
VRDVIRRRLTRLPELTNQLLVTAAVVGREFDLAVVAHATQVEEPTALELMDLAVAFGIIVEDSETVDGYRFTHPLLQQTLYAELGRGRRARLHARVAELLQSRSGEDATRAVELAHHWFQAAAVTGPQPGVAAALRAADAAQARLAYEQAEDQLRRALDLLERMPLGPQRSRTELSVQNRLAGVLIQTQGFASQAVAEAWGRARELCRDVAVPADLLPLLWGLFTLSLSRLELSVASEVASELRELAGVATEPAFRLAGHLGSGIVQFHSGDLVAARNECGEAVAVCNAHDDRGALVGTFLVDPVVISSGYLSLASSLLGDKERARQISGRAVGIARRRGHPFSLISALLFQGWLGILDEDLVSVRDCVQQIQANGPGSQEGMAITISAWSRGTDEYPQAHAELRQAISGLRSNGFRLSGTLYLGFLADLHLQAHRPQAALATVDEALTEVEVTGERFYEAELCRLRGEALIMHGRERAEEAQCWLRRAGAVADSQQAISLRQRVDTSLSRLSEARNHRSSGFSGAAP